MGRRDTSVSAIFLCIYSACALAWGPLFAWFYCADHCTTQDALFVLLVNSLVWLVGVPLDMMLSHRFAANVASIEYNGFSRWRLAAYFLFNVVLAGSGGVLLTCLYDAENITPHYDLMVWIKIAFFLALADYGYFYWAHRHMHQSPAWRWIHKLHHCARVPSFTTNFMFHPIDFALEFGVSVGGSFLLFKTNMFGLYDPWLHTLFVIATQMWYGLDHDPFLFLTHYDHHFLIDSHYYAYEWRHNRRDDRESLRRVIKTVPGSGVPPTDLDKATKK